MSNKQTFQVYHGPGNVRYGPTGVDLSDFIVSERGIDRPAERSVPSIKGWLMRGLRVDPQTSDITINVIDPGVQMNMDDGEGPSAEVNETSVEEVNAREDGGVVAPVGIQPGGVADEGETVGAIVDEMEREDSDNERVEEGDSSDDETDINPAEWASQDFSGLIVSEEDSVRWEYKKNEVIQGAIYSRAEDMKEAVKHFAVSLHREFRVAKSNRSQYEVRCVKEKDGCPWRVHAYKGKWKDYWTVSVVTKHTCFLPGVQKYHRNITCAFVASEMYAHVIDNLTYEPRSIIRHIEETYKYTISYAKAWRAKQKIIEMRFGTYEASYDNLPRLLGVIEERNPGSSYEVKKFPSIEHPGKSVLQRAFLALHACKMAFVNCHPVLCIDGTFLTGKYRGQILTATGVDGTIRHAGILRAIGELQFGSMERGYTGVWEHVQSRWCMRHLGATFFKQFKNKELMNMFKRLCNQNQEKKFNELWKRLDELTAKCSDQRAAAPSTAVADPPQALGPLPTDSPTLKKLEELRKKAMKHRVLVQGTQQHRRSVAYQIQYMCHSTSVSKQYIIQWSGEIYGFGIAGEFTETNDEVLNIPDPSKLRGKAGRRRTRRIRNDMDESEAGRVKLCSKCDEHGHTYKHCPKDKEKPSAAEAGLSGSAADGARPTDGTSGYTSAVGPGDRSPTPVSPTAVQGAQLGTFRARTCGELLTVHDSFVERLREAGLLPMCRLVEAAAGDADPARRWTVDRSLVAALVDRWRPETHTFHLPCGEVAPTLQDVSYLLGLPLAGDAVGPVTTAVDWQDDLTARFALVQRAPHLPLEPLAHHRNTGPTKRWLLQLTVEQLQAEADEYSYSRCLEAYLLWLFGWVMFCGGHGHAVDKGLVHYARSIADAAVGEVPQWSWGSALLAALYRALCESCTKTDPSATFGGCPLFLSIWAAERIAIGRPEVDQHAYEESLYEERPEVDYPTMGTLWCRRQRRWAHVQVRRSYPEFVMEFDRLLTTDVVWEPYSAAATQARAPLGLSTLCTRDQAYWMTTVPMVFDICVEPHAPFRVMWQFGFRQPFPVPFPTTVPAAVHRYSRKGQQSAGDWPAKLATFVEDWLLATEEVVDHEGEPHTEESYQAYLRWYQPRTRTRVDDINRVVVDGSTTIQRLDAGIPVPVEEYLTTYTRMVESMRSILRVLTCRADDVARADAAVQWPPVPTGPCPAAHVPRPTPPPHGGFRAPFSTPPSSARPSVVPPTGFAQFAMTQAAHFSQAAGSASQAAGTSSQGPPLDHAGTSSDPFLSSTVLFDITDFDFASGSTEDVIGPSQLGGAPPVQTQDQAQATPPRDTRATRAVPPDRFTYSQDHVRAQARRTKHGRGAGQGQ
uniref:OSJNBb0085C12.3 protein n=2 Tax=Oryza sativa subsp. japonica TaxID=39947 RepID=Q7XSJ2_ORYSJ|nr:OSJNBb0085C12.3 [Oryza sativa Japonica Group]